ncbi:uncharacterized protein LOC110752774 [Prunus avium]|uniref:Uncharacterized protein LOC110752774 n=1 Tax=Prunus avium TaxID=42229 RepID=A0A6P5S6K1_PRUAV|nr:uncharacterized protein LOC110752774 [Prunus avium]
MKSSDRALQELKLFHTIDRNIYSRLLMGLGFDPILSKYIVALWHTLERQSIGQKFMVNTLFLHDPFFNDLANESFELLKRLYSDCVHPPFEDIDSQFPKLRLLVPVKVSLSSVFNNKEHTKQIMEEFVNKVCERAFSDIVPIYPYLAFIPQPIVSQQPLLHLMNGLIVQQGFQNSVNLCVDPNVVEAQPSLPAQEACDERPDRHQPNADKNERTLFLTFSRGHPVSEEELRGFFTRKFGECIEAICMGAEERNSQPLFARVVVKSSSDITKILVGVDDSGKVKFSIHGKDVIVRRFFPRQNK